MIPAMEPREQAFLAAARALAPVIRECRAEIDRERRLPERLGR
jgi:hypothetical protein